MLDGFTLAELSLDDPSLTGGGNKDVPGPCSADV
jgi:hypothetical protein